MKARAGFISRLSADRELLLLPFHLAPLRASENCRLAWPAACRLRPSVLKSVGCRAAPLLLANLFPSQAAWAAWEGFEPLARSSTDKELLPKSCRHLARSSTDKGLLPKSCCHLARSSTDKELLPKSCWQLACSSTERELLPKSCCHLARSGTDKELPSKSCCRLARSSTDKGGCCQRAAATKELLPPCTLKH